MKDIWCSRWPIGRTWVVIFPCGYSLSHIRSLLLLRVLLRAMLKLTPRLFVMLSMKDCLSSLLNLSPRILVSMVSDAGLSALFAKMLSRKKSL